MHSQFFKGGLGSSFGEPFDTTDEKALTNNNTNSSKVGIDINNTTGPTISSEFNLTQSKELIEEKDPLPEITGPSRASEYLGPESIKNITGLDNMTFQKPEESIPSDNLKKQNHSIVPSVYNTQYASPLRFVAHTPLPHDLFNVYMLTDANGLNGIGCDGTGEWNSAPEPAVASDGSKSLLTGNWFVAKSVDRGNTWDCGAIGYHVNFTHLRNGNGNNCCDNDVVYREPYFYWFRQGGDGRINIARSTDLTNWNFDVIVDTNNDFIPEMNLSSVLAANGLNSSRGICIGESRPECNVNFWLDYPKMTVSSEYLYVSTSVMLGCGRQGLSSPPCGHGDNLNFGSLVLRAKIDDLNQNIADQGYFAQAEHHFFDPNYKLGYAFAEGSQGTMYLATSTGTDNTLRICTWRGVPADQAVPVPIAPSCTNQRVGVFNTGAATCTGYDNRDWCADTGGGQRIQTGFYRAVDGGRVGFYWNVAQDPVNGTVNYPKPWIKAAVFRVESAGGLTYLQDESARYSVASRTYWIQLPYVSSTNDGLGLLALYGDWQGPPGVLVGLLDSYSGQNWELRELDRRAYSDTGQCTSIQGVRLGDYTRLRPFGGYQNDPRGMYVGAGFIFDGSSSTSNCPDSGPTVRVIYVVFGRGAVNDIWLGPDPTAMEQTQEDSEIKLEPPILQVDP